MRKATGTISVFTFKDGILARAAHDLALRMEQVDVALDGAAVTATLPLAALKVIGPVEDGVILANRYDDSKRGEVEAAMHGSVLRTAHNPTARFDGQAMARGNGFAVTGSLQLAGRTAPLSFEVSQKSDGDGAVFRARFDLQPSRWGIAPYKALLGAIKVRDMVRVQLELREAEA